MKAHMNNVLPIPHLMYYKNCKKKTKNVNAYICPSCLQAKYH